MAKAKTKRPLTPPPQKQSKKVKASSKPQQSSIATFFTSPSKPKPKQQGRSSPVSVISIADSDDDDDHVPQIVSPFPDKSPQACWNGKRSELDNVDQIESDEVLARKLASEWSENGDLKMDKGKGKAIEPETIEDDDDIVLTIPLSPGINGSSSSSRPVHHLPSPPSESKPVHPMFAKRPKTPPRSTSNSILKKTPTTPRGETKITSSAAEPVEAIDFDTDAVLFKPGEIDSSKWPKGRLPYSVLAGVYVQVSSTRSRLLIVRVLTNFLHLVLHTSPVDLPATMYLLSNHLLPSYLPCELGVGSSVLSKIVKEVSGATPGFLNDLWKKYGDPGDVAFEAKSNLRTLVTPAPLLVHDVYGRLLSLARVKGKESGKVKGDIVRKLLVQARGEEVRYLVRTLVGNLRIGAVRTTLLTSLARAAALFEMPRDLIDGVRPLRTDKKKQDPDPTREQVEALCLDAVKLVRRVYVRHPNYADLVRGLSDGGLVGLEDRVPVSVGIPLSPMLGSITRSLDEVFTRLGNLPFTAEAKLDGQRVQIHARMDGPQGEDDGGRWVEADGHRVWVRLFSRHLEDMTEKYPDVCALALSLLTRPITDCPPFPATASTPSSTALSLLSADHISSLIIDAEIVAVDKDTGAHRTFQELTNRAKKDVRVEDIKVVVEVCAFDLMLINDTPLLGLPFSHRRHLLRALIPPLETDPSHNSTEAGAIFARFSHVPSLDSTDCGGEVKEEMGAFFARVVEQKCEGLMVKLLESGEGIAGEDDEEEGGEEEGDGKKTQGRKKPLPATYEPDQRSQGWLKVKKDYVEGLGDSLDLVPIGAWWGQGRKAGWWSPILLAAYNPDTGALEAVCKCISGFTDAFYKDLFKRYPPEDLPEKCNKREPLAYCETNGLRPSVWFAPSEVWEIRGADITLSPVYPAAASYIGSERGLSLRFPRFIKVRDDKGIEQATTSEQFAEMYRKQIRAPPENKGPNWDVLNVKSGKGSSEGDGEGEGEGDGEEEGEEVGDRDQELQEDE